MSLAMQLFLYFLLYFLLNVFGNSIVFVLSIVDVVMENIIVASLFLKEVSVEVHMLLIRIDTDEAAPTLVLEH